MEMYLCYWCILVIYLPLVTVFSQGIFRRKQRPPIDGSWSAWQRWSACYKNVKNTARTTSKTFFSPWENFNIQSRNRTCTSPKPLFGGKQCELPSHRFRQCSCMNPLIGKDRIKDSFLSASNSRDGYPAKEVRFQNISAGWCAIKQSFFTEAYIQIDFQNFTNVGAISTIDNTKGRVTRYKLKYSLNGKTWSFVHKDESNIVFTGNYLRGRRKKNNFSTHLVMRYLRVIPVQSFGLPCLKMEVYGCVFTCGSKLTAPFGELAAQSSENYDQNCLWRVEVLKTTSLTFVFNIFYVRCEDGYIAFHDSDFPFINAPLLKMVCLRDGDVQIPNLRLNRNSVWIKFVSNSSSNEVSFVIKYFSKCRQTIHLKRGEPVHIKSPNFPNKYFDNLNCSWTLIPPSSYRKIEINVNEFSVESSRSTDECSDDVVYIDTEHNGGIKKKYASYCNTRRPPKKIVILADKVIISFRSDLYTNDKGFSFSVISGLKGTLTTITSIDDTDSLTPKSDISDGHTNGKTDDMRKRKPNSTYTRKVKPPKDDTWTVIIICTFSALVVVLIGTVLYLNCRRFINSRNELSAQCAKAAEENRQKKNKKKHTNAHQRNVLLTPQSSPIKRMVSTSPENEVLLTATKGNMEDINEPEEMNDHIKHIHSELDVHNEMLQSPDQVDGGESTSCGTSTPSCSPVKSMVINCGSSNEEAEESVI